MFGHVPGGFILKEEEDDRKGVDYFGVLRVFDGRLWLGVVLAVILLPVLCCVVEGDVRSYWRYWEETFGGLVLQGRSVNCVGW